MPWTAAADVCSQRVCAGRRAPVRTAPMAGAIQVAMPAPAARRRNLGRNRLLRSGRRHVLLLRPGRRPHLRRRRRTASGVPSTSRRRRTPRRPTPPSPGVNFTGAPNFAARYGRRHSQQHGRRLAAADELLPRRHRRLRPVDAGGRHTVDHQSPSPTAPIRSATSRLMRPTTSASRPPIAVVVDNTDPGGSILAPGADAVIGGTRRPDHRRGRRLERHPHRALAALGERHQRLGQRQPAGQQRGQQLGRQLEHRDRCQPSAGRRDLPARSCSPTTPATWTNTAVVRRDDRQHGP